MENLVGISRSYHIDLSSLVVVHCMAAIGKQSGPGVERDQHPRVQTYGVQNHGNCFFDTHEIRGFFWYSVSCIWSSVAENEE